VWTHIAVWAARTSLFRRFTDTDVYVIGSVKTRKTRHKISVDIRILFTVSLACVAQPTGKCMRVCEISKQLQGLMLLMYRRVEYVLPRNNRPVIVPRLCRRCCDDKLSQSCSLPVVVAQRQHTSRVVFVSTVAYPGQWPN